MLRDMELIRSLLTDIAEDKYKKVAFELPLIRVQDEQVSEDEKIAYHLEIMRQANLITYKEQRFINGMRLMELPKLTWTGQDYHGAINNDSIWEKTKQTISKNGAKLSGVPLEIIVSIAKVKMREMFGLPIE